MMMVAALLLAGFNKIITAT